MIKCSFCDETIEVLTEQAAGRGWGILYDGDTQTEITHCNTHILEAYNQFSVLRGGHGYGVAGLYPANAELPPRRLLEIMRKGGKRGQAEERNVCRMPQPDR